MHRSTLPLALALAALGPSAIAQAPGACALEDAAFATLDGGCKDLTSGLVWSADYFQVYQSSGATILTFMAAEDYAQDLVEGGFDDWRLPTRDELLALHANGGASHLNLPDPLNYHWSSTKSGRMRYIVRISDGDTLAVNRTSRMMTICVREIGSGGGGNNGGGGNGNGKNRLAGSVAGNSGQPHAVRFVRGEHVHVRLSAAPHAGRVFAVVASVNAATTSALPTTPHTWLGMPDLTLVSPGQFDP